jgi:hypothetical protein
MDMDVLVDGSLADRIARLSLPAYSVTVLVACSRLDTLFLSGLYAYLTSLVLRLGTECGVASTAGLSAAHEGQCISVNGFPFLDFLFRMLL